MTENPPQQPGGRPARGGTATDHDPREQVAVEGPWVAVVWNDPVNLMSYVVYVFRAHFGYASPRAEQLMRLVHERGRAVVARGTREQMESDVHALHGYGLRATVEPVPEAPEQES
ncbi:ATP-dependent Clp protease adapter ClpS [Brachybacterium sp. AOP25-B2-12]|uniref:ATP-dependent Clp protease adapter ClpS n=1 Tax=Brachybacterium sp. AOP25-B2-12 TaxID=3457710 RepID=UPI004033A058